MAKFFYSIPLPNHAGLIEAQQYLRSKLPEGATFVDPSDFHMTLLFVEDAEGVTDWAVPANLPVFGMGSDYVNVFNNKSDNGYPVVLAIPKNPQMSYLQAGLFYEAQAQEAKVSPFSWPGMWKPHVTLAYSPTEYPYSEILPSIVLMEAKEFILTAEGGEVLQRYPFTATITQAMVSEMAVIRDAVIVNEFKGVYPDVPLFDDIDIAELTAGEDDPLFVTMLIGQDGMISEAPNKRHYSAAFIREMERQIYEKRPVGNQGHVAKEDRATEYPTPALYWVGKKREGKNVFGKAYVPVSETSAMLRRVRAAKGETTTSLYGMGTQTWNAELGAWDVDPETFELESIDLAPPERAGVQALAGVPHLTSEMNDKSPSNEPNKQKQEGAMPNEKEKKEVTPVDRATVISEMVEKDFVLLPDVVRDAVIAAAPQTKIVAEMREALGIDDNTSSVQAVKNLVAELADIKAKSLVTEIKMAVDTAIKVETVRPVVLALVNARSPKAGEVAKIVQEIADSDAVKPLLESALLSEMGGRQQRPADKDKQQGENSMLAPAAQARIDKANADAIAQ